MCSCIFDIEVYMNLLDNFINQKELTDEEFNYLNDYAKIKRFYKTINEYDKHILMNIPFYDDETEEYYYIVSYKNKFYRTSNDDLKDTYSVSIVDSLKEEEQENIIDMQKVIDHNKSGQVTKKLCRKRTKKEM